MASYSLKLSTENFGQTAADGDMVNQSINQSIYLFQTTRIHSKQRTDDRKVTEYTNETDRNTVTGV